MFQPPRCPYVRCRAHSNPSPRFYRSKGPYHPNCRPHPIPRFTCKHCERSFSRQTFRADYRDHYPHLNARLFELLQLKFRKIARHLWRVHRNLTGSFPDGVEFQLDEMETYEGRRNTRPLTLRRRSWLGTKLARYLNVQLAFFITYRNYVRRRFNRDEQTPAEMLGFVDRPMRKEQLLSWRQNWGRQSIHPLCRRRLKTVADVQDRGAAFA